MKHSLLLLLVLISSCMSASAQCAGPISYNVIPQPSAGGTYYPGQVVTFCLTEDSFTQTGENWFHGLTLNLGPGWDTSTLYVNSLPLAASGAGNWNYYPNGIISYATGRYNGPGFYFGTDAGAINGSFAADGNNPGENYGDNCQALTCSWTFCFSLQVRLNAIPGTSLSLSATATGDHLSGSWDGSGCQACDSDTLVKTNIVLNTTAVGDAIFIEVINATDVSCNGLCDGSISAAAYFGTPPYSFRWSTGDTLDSLTGLCTGTYSCTVTDARDSAYFASRIIKQPSALSIADSIINTCDSQCNGVIFLDVAGGTSPYYYLWNGNIVTPGVLYGLCAGTVFVKVTDSRNCVADTSFRVASIYVPQTYITDTICNGDSIYFYYTYHKVNGTDTAHYYDGPGCDSVVILNLVVQNRLTTFLYDTICVYDSLFYDSTYYHHAGTYTFNYPEAGYCDSTVILQLTVKQVPDNVTFSWDSLIALGDVDLKDSVNQGTYWCSEVNPGAFVLSGGEPPGGYYIGTEVKNDTLYADSINGAGDNSAVVTYYQFGSNGCLASASELLIITNCTGIAPVNSDNLFDLHPNPAGDYTSVEISTEFIGSRLGICDISGQELEVFKLSQNIQLLPLTGLSAGVYLVMLDFGLMHQVRLLVKTE